MNYDAVQYGMLGFGFGFGFACETFIGAVIVFDRFALRWSDS